MRRATWVVLVGLAWLAVCGGPQPQDLRVGVHALSVITPDDWEHLDYGTRHHFRRDFARISIEDLQRPGRDLKWAAEHVLERLGENERREVASSVLDSVGRREVLKIDTWDRVSHEHRKRYVFVNNLGELLVVYTMQGSFETMQAAFEELVASITFAESLVVDR